MESVIEMGQHRGSKVWDIAKSFGPGILMATAAVGGSHIVSATQAGALFGWQLLILVILVNIFKYPFMRIGSEYTLTTGKTLIEGYRGLKPWYATMFFVLMVFSTISNLAAVAMLSGTLIQFVVPQMSITVWTLIVLVVSWLMIIFGGFKILDKFSKFVMFFLTVFTVVAVVISLGGHDHAFASDFVAKSPWHFASLPFLISLMGWMPAPIELSVISSMWTVAKREQSGEKISKKYGLLDFDISYIVTVILAVCFLAMGALIQYGKGTAIEGASAAYIKQFVSMYSSAFGGWSGVMIAVVAFLCIFGTTVTVLDGYVRTTKESFNVVFKKPGDLRGLKVWFTVAVVLAGILNVGFVSNIALLMKIAMIISFITAPFFAFLNFKVALNTPEMKLSKPMFILNILGLIFLSAFALVFIYAIFTGHAGI